MVIDFQFMPLVRKTAFGYYSFSEGLSPVYLPAEDREGGRKPAVIDKTGKVLFELPGTPLGPFGEGYLPLLYGKTKRHGLIDRNGKWHPIPTKADLKTFVFGVKDGVMVVLTNGKYGYLKIREDS